MLPASVLERFVERCPAAVMVRATLENLLKPERLRQIFKAAAQRQYEKQLLFSELVALMSAVATRTHGSVHAAYLEAQAKLGVSPAAVYDKLKRLEPAVSAALVRETAADAAAAIDAMKGGRRSLLPGLEVFYLDGNHLAATEHRLVPLRTTREGPLPGQTLALLDAQRGLIMELVPGEDGYAQERSLLPALLERIAKGMVIVGDRNFCTTQFLFGLAARGAFFVIRQHASTLTWRRRGRRKRLGRVDTGQLFEQELELREGDRKGAATLRVRQITVKLDRPTESGDTEIRILTNLTAKQASAKAAAEVYHTRGTIECAFQTLTDVLRCEVATLGYPKAALFSFAAAVLALNAYAVVKAALRSAHGAATIDEKLSDHHLVRHVVLAQLGLEIAVAPKAWRRHQEMSPRELARELVRLAKHVDLSRYPKKKRGPKRPTPKKKSGRRNHHISTARTLAEARGE